MKKKAFLNTIMGKTWKTKNIQINTIDFIFPLYGIGRLKVKGWKKMYYISTNQKKANVVMLYTVDFRKGNIRNGEKHYIVIRDQPIKNTQQS